MENFPLSSLELLLWLCVRHQHVYEKEGPILGLRESVQWLTCPSRFLEPLDIFVYHTSSESLAKKPNKGEANLLKYFINL